MSDAIISWVHSGGGDCVLCSCSCGDALRRLRCFAVTVAQRTVSSVLAAVAMVPLPVLLHCPGATCRYCSRWNGDCVLCGSSRNGCDCALCREVLRSDVEVNYQMSVILV